MADVRSELSAGLRVSRLAIVAVLGLGLSAPAASAPSTAGDDPPLIADGVLGAAGALLQGFSIEGTVTTIYDSNFQRFGGNLNGDNSTLRVSPLASLRYSTSVGQQRLFATGSIGRDIFVDNSEFNSNRYSAGGGVDWKLGVRCRGNVSADFSSAQNLVTEVAQLVNNVQERTSFGGSARCQGPVGFGLGIDVRRQIVDNSRPERFVFDLRTTQISPQITYASPVLGQFTLGGTLARTRYPNRPVLTADGTVADAVDIYSGRFGYSRTLGARLQVALGVSYFDVKPDPDLVIGIANGLPAILERPGFSGLGFDAAATYKAGPRLSITASANRGVQASGNVGSQFLVSEAYGLDLDYRLSQALTAGVGGTLNNRKFRNSFISVDEPVARISETARRVYGQLSYSPRSFYSVDFEVAHQERESNPAVLNFSSTTALLRLRVKFGR